MWNYMETYRKISNSKTVSNTYLIFHSHKWLKEYVCATKSYRPPYSREKSCKLNLLSADINTEASFIPLNKNS